jgi:type II secretory pathway component PulM
MKPGFTARRGAEEFHSIVEGTSTMGPGSTRYDEFLELVATLREVAPVEPRADFVADLRRQLMTEAATVLTPTAARLTVTPRRSPRERRIAVIIGGFAVVSATTSMAMASQTALPGDTLYPLKRALENASTTIQIDEDDKGASLLAHASGRLDEVNELTRQSDEPNPQAVADTLHAFADQASSASDLMIAAYSDSGQESEIEELRTFAATSMAALTELETVVPDTARAALIEAAQVLNGIDSVAFQLCPSCGDGVAQVPEFEAASVNDTLDDLGSALAAPLTGPEPGKPPAKDNPGGPSADDDDPSQDPKSGNKPDRPIEFPGPIPDEVTTNGGSNDGGDGGNDAGGNVINDLTDRLTGGGRPPTNNQGTLAEVLDDALGNIVNGLLGQ